MTKRLACMVHGEVQGVSYRAFVSETARGLGLVGFVRNRADGTVEVITEGEEEKLKTLLRALEEDHPYADVERVNAHWGEATAEFDGFHIQ